MSIPALDTISEFLYQIASNPTVMTVLLTLIIAITLGELFKRIFKSKILGFLVTTTALIWIYEEIVKGKSVFDILISMISLLAFFIAAFIVALKLFVKKLIPSGG
jgi:apolipoprotein N-acyltransferase